MAEYNLIKISQLPVLNTGDMQSDDALVIVDTSTSTTKKLSPDAFLKMGDAYLESEYIQSFTGEDGEPIITGQTGLIAANLLDTAAIQAEVDDTYKKGDFIDSFTGIANEPIITGLNGKVPASLLDILTFNFVDSFTPTGVTEYPDTTGYVAGEGATWIVEGLAVGGYLFAGGDLIGETVYNDAYMVYGVDNWVLMHNSSTGGFSTEWGTITGTLTNQLDLNNALGLKADQSDLDTTNGNVSTNAGNISTNASDISDLQTNKADQTALNSHVTDTDNPHQVNATDVGLGSVDDTADADKPISDATQSALDLKADVSEVAITTGSPVALTNMWSGTQAQYDGLTPDENTLYYIVG